ncbi:MAG: glycosyltransferase family A protein [Opitutaceae bacterium]
MNATVPFTIAIAARNAATTIERAVRSVVAEPDCPVLLVDDHCTDDTVSRARAVAGDRLRVVRAPDPGGVTLARQTALESVETEYAAWLDADDEWIPGRATRLSAALASGADVATEAINLHDGASGAFLRRLAIPEFVRLEATPARLFERNHLPGDTQVAFRTAVFREAGGYDPSLGLAESFDLLLRAIARGARFFYGREAGYRMYAYPQSASRDLARQRAALARALRKHEFGNVRGLCIGAGETPRVAAWVLVSMALFREEPAAALAFLEEASPADADPAEILEREGPWPFAEGWRRAFQRGTCLLLIGGHDAEAAAELGRAEALEPTPEGANNLGVALARCNRLEDAQRCFAQSEVRFPGYLDARLNRAATLPDRITTHPLRRQASRSEY